jgi:hypothetical protein
MKAHSEGMHMRNAENYVMDDGAGNKTITSFAYYLTPEGINPFCALIVRKAIESQTDEGFKEGFDGASKEEARRFLDHWELCHMPYWGVAEVAQVICISDPGRNPQVALRAVELAQKAGELPSDFSPQQGVEWAKARGYLITGELCKLAGLRAGSFGHPHNPLPMKGLDAPADTQSTLEATAAAADTAKEKERPVHAWIIRARAIGQAYLERHTEKKLFPSQMDVGKHVANALREESIYGPHGRPLEINTVLREALQGEWWKSMGR